ncbi:MAG: RagB/SusD family nutrient uptake outer membrane protein [Prevotella sp.]|nr:RagB/SusD family nutrient uptake outer membrane protein [Prevotella sp.]
MIAKSINSLLRFCVGCGLVATLASCSDYLDELPDNRAALDTDEKITDLLVSAYPNTSGAMIAELYSDNTDRNDESSAYTPYRPTQEQAATWQDVTETIQDTPYALWDQCYKSIAAANNVIFAIEKEGRPERLNPQLGEALLCRAYCHFMLANIFCKAYSPKTCNEDLGVTYINRVLTEVTPVYPRGTMAELYRHIADDIEEGLPLVSDELHDVLRYHFNTRAACAFAARFYLYYMQEDKSNLDKAIYYANRVLGTSTPENLRDWQTLGKVSIVNGERANAFVSADSKANLLLLSTNSYWEWLYGPTSVGFKYTHNDKIAETETVKSRGFWGDHNSFYFGVDVSTSGPKVLMYKLAMFIQYTDVTKGIGYPKMMMPVLTTDALLLERAEAYALKGDFANAYQDLNTWQLSFTKTTATVDAERLENIYGEPKGTGMFSTIGMEYYTPDEPTPKKRLNPDFTVQPGEQENLIHAILHARRVTTLHEGLRWQDVKRYGIEIYRRAVKEGNITVYDTMTKDDPRRAIQLPSNVIKAGITPNPR